MSLTHLLLLALICTVAFKRHSLPALGRGIGEGFRQFKKGIKGEADIDITETARRLPNDED